MGKGDKAHQLLALKRAKGRLIFSHMRSHIRRKFLCIAPVTITKLQISRPQDIRHQTPLDQRQDFGWS